MGKQRLKLVAGGLAGAFLVLVLAAVGGWYFFIRSDAPPKVSLASAIDSLATTQATAAASASTAAPSATSSPTADPSVAPANPNGGPPAGGFPPGGPGGPGGPNGGPPGGGNFGVQAAPIVAAPALPANSIAASSAGVAGTWVPDSAQQSFVGYRVDEELASIGSNTVVGRTSNVSGQVVLTTGNVASASFTADTTTLKSDNSQRDGQLRNQAIEYAKYPTATFELTEPISLPSGLAAGQPISTSLKGKFTLHGVTKQVTIPAQAQLVGNNLVVVGSLDIAFSDYSVSKPRGGPVLSIKDNAAMEFQLILKRQ